MDISTPKTTQSDCSSSSQLEYCQLQDKTKSSQNLFRRSPMENVQIIQIRNTQNQLTCHTRTKPQWNSKVIINSENCEKQLARDIECEHSREDMEKKMNKEDKDGHGIADISESRNIGECHMIPDTMSSQEQHLQNSFLKRSRSVFTSDKGKVEVLQLKQQCRSLESELENVKTEIVKILKEKAGTLEENGILKEYKRSYEDLETENKELKHQIFKMIENEKSDIKGSESLGTKLPSRSSPDGQEIGSTQQQPHHCEDGTTWSQHDESIEINRKLDSKPRIRFLEESLSMMKYEFEQMENYWNRKRENERKLYEEQVNQKERTMLKMQLKLKGYENQLSRTSSVARRSKPHTENRETVGQNTIKIGDFKDTQRSCLNQNNFSSERKCSLYRCKGSCDGTTNESFSLRSIGLNSENRFCSNASQAQDIHQDLAKSVVNEIIRLQDLRSAIQEECDFLVHQKLGLWN